MAERNRKKQTKPQVIDVELAVEAPAAQIVCLAGSFNQWCPESLPLHRDSDGRFRIKVPLPPGRHEYKFVVDGQWIHDPQSAATCANCHGSRNSIIEVGQR